MGQVTITIDRREYAITCDDGQEGHIIKLSRVLDEKARALSGGAPINENMKLALVGLLLADEMQELKARVAATPEVNFSALDGDMAQRIDEQTNRINHLIKEIKPL